MEFKINYSPDLSMTEITKLLFNKKFLSDVQFCVGDKTIYAHSLELMKRSIVFQEKLVNDSFEDKKLIVIDDVSYDALYQFIRFIYTDECKIENSNAIGLLKLASRYKVIKLENEIIRVFDVVEMNLSLYEYCLLENNQMLLPWAHRLVVSKLKDILPSTKFLSIHSVVVEEILKSDQTSVSEFEMFLALVQWIDKNRNDINVREQRDHHDKLISLVRFPLMSPRELYKCRSEYPHLFKIDLASFMQLSSETTNNSNNQWNSKKRIAYSLPYRWEKLNTKTIFTVNEDMLLAGLRFGGDMRRTPAQVIISETYNRGFNSLKINCGRKLDNSSHYVNLGESIRLQPNKEYTIEIELTEFPDNSLYAHRAEKLDVFINISRSLIQFSQVCGNIYEIYFKLINASPLS